MKFLKSVVLFGLVLALGFSFIACDEEKDDSGNNAPDVDAWVGSWISAGANVAPILVTAFNYDSVLVAMNDDGTLTTNSHIAGGAWTGEMAGTYTVTEEAAGTIHSIEIVYAAFEQAGIIQVTEGTPDVMLMEVVQTVPDYGFVPHIPADGFGNDAVWGDTNIQTYERE